MGSSISALLIISVLLTSVIVMFRSNQIGMNLLAEANRNAAEYRSEKLDSAFELSSEITTLSSYNEVDAQGCKPLYTGIMRKGQIGPGNKWDCYWFDGPTASSFDIDYFRNIVSTMNRTSENRLSFDYYHVGSPVTETNEGPDSNFEDVSDSAGSISFTTTTTSDLNNKHHLKVWYFGDASNPIGTHRGKYSITLDFGDAVDLSTVQCVDKFRLKNLGQSSFPVESPYFLDNVDVFVQLRPANQPEVMTKLTRSDSNILGNNEWVITLPETISINGTQEPNDVYEPSIFNSSEVLQLSTKLNNYNQESGTLILIWPNGLKTTENFDSLCNN